MRKKRRGGGKGKGEGREDAIFAILYVHKQWKYTADNFLKMCIHNSGKGWIEYIELDQQNKFIVFIHSQYILFSPKYLTQFVITHLFAY